MSSTAPQSSAPSASAAASPIPLFDMQRQYESLQHEIMAALSRVCDSSRFVLGPDCEALERSLGSYCGAKHAISCASGSDALLLALMACGVGSGDEVVMPSYTFFATASAAWRLGAKPVFADIDPVTFNLDPSAAAAAITPKTKAIIPVHLYGQCADMEALTKTAKARQIPLIEDACQAIGAAYDGRPAGSLGDIGCFSFYPTKNLGGFGDGGLLTTNRDDLAATLRLLRVHGMEPRYYHQIVGINSRLDSMQAAVLNVKLPHLNHWTAARQANADRYVELFAAYGLERILTLPQVAPRQKHVWNQYIVRVPDGKRDALRQHLTQAKVGTEIYYPVPLHAQPCFVSMAVPPGTLPETERAALETLALPIFPELTVEEQQRVVEQIATFFGVQRGGAHGSAAAKTNGVKRPKFMGHAAADQPAARLR